MTSADREEVGMAGHSTYRSPLRFMGALVLSLGLLTTMFDGGAYAHSFGDHKKQRKHVKERSRSAIGSPYRSGGTSRSGFDCSGFTRWTFQNHGANLPRTSTDQFYLAKRKGNARIWKRKNLKVGDLVFHKTTSARVGHAGIFIGNGKFISSTSSGGVRVKSIWDPHYWGPRWVGGTRLKVTRA